MALWCRPLLVPDVIRPAYRPESRARPQSASGAARGTTATGLLGAEDLGQLEGRGHIELIESTAHRVAVGAPAAELGGVAQAGALEVLERGLDDQLGA